MNRIEKLVAASRRVGRQAAFLALTCSMWLMTTDLAWAKRAKKELEEAETKSYVVPYMIVIALVAVGLMTVCRPSRRLDKADEKQAKEEED